MFAQPLVTPCCQQCFTVMPMRRADRLFQIMLLLGRGKVLTGNTLAVRLGVSRRTVYRDIQDLALSGVPIEGAAGTGFHLRGGFQVPPLMFTPEDLQALVFGARLERKRSRVPCVSPVSHGDTRRERRALWL